MNVESKNEMFFHKSCTIKASCDRCKGPRLLTHQPGGSVLIHCPKCNPEFNRTMGRPTKPGLYYLKRRGLPESNALEYLSQEAIDSKWDIEWHREPKPEAHQKRPLPWRVINLKNMKSVAVCDANGVTLFEDRGFANESEKEFSAARISEMVASHNTLAKLKPVVEELLQAVRRGWFWQTDEIRERCEAVRKVLN